ncbi:MAG: tRNA 5'-guanylyltransferase [Thermoprotei archaeon]|nr:MAG: tRNA 5'-guanylyltransferase [Thermoprotei archaeon]
MANRAERLAEKFKASEAYASLKVPRDIFFVVRCDGRSFKELCDRAGFAKPFDLSFAKIMVSSAKAVYEGGFNPLFAYIHSDEANFLFNGELSFNRRVEKLVSVIPSLMSSRAALELYKALGVELPLSFDARVVLLDRSRVVDYFVWRQMEAWRNHVNSYAYYVLLSKGVSPEEASRRLKGLKAPQLHELVFKEAGLNLASTPTWQRRGVALAWIKEIKEGYDPIKGGPVQAVRIKLREVWELPVFNSEEGRKLIEDSVKARLKESEG